MSSATSAYIAIDLKSFYASVECVERGLNPLDTHLVVADLQRTNATICLALTPPLKQYGLGGRERLFTVVERVNAINAERRRLLPHGTFTGESASAAALKAHPDWALRYVVAPPRMSLYLTYSTRIHQIYLKYVASEDIHVYSVDEVFIDATPYLAAYRCTARELAGRMIRDVLSQTGITATAGIGTNLYLCKVAMDIVAKHIQADSDGVRIAELDEMSYRRQLWNHRPLTDFWRVGRGIAGKLAPLGLDTMGKIARYSINNEEQLYRLFGTNAELLIDHAWGWEPCTLPMIKAYRPDTHSLSHGQVLPSPYAVKKARVVIHEMVDAIALTLVSRRLVTDQVTLTIGYHPASLISSSSRPISYRGPIVRNHYGKLVPKPAQGRATLQTPTSSARLIAEAVLQLFDRIANPDLLIHRINLATLHVISEQEVKTRIPQPVQLDLFTDYTVAQRQARAEKGRLEKERRMQEAVISIRQKFGKNALLKGLNFAEGATAMERNQQIGGHKA